MRKILCVLMLMSAITSCKIVHSVIELNRTRAKVYKYSLNGKEIRFIPMHHLGKKGFYEDVKKEVSLHKSQGYRLYYELISTDFKADSLQKDTIRRKVRKLKGFSGNYKENAGGPFFSKYIQQPSYKELGSTPEDIRADVDYLQLVKEWEKTNGAIVLDSLDYAAPFSHKYSKVPFYTKRQYNSIFIQYRNEQLINLLKSGSDQKILILYGAGHKSDFRKRLKRSNRTQ